MQYEITTWYKGQRVEYETKHDFDEAVEWAKSRNPLFKVAIVPVEGEMKPGLTSYPARKTV